MAEKKVFAQIDVLGSNQTPMDAFIYMEDQGGGGGDENPVRLEPHITVQESGHIEMTNATAISYSSDPEKNKYFRVQFDLVID